MSYEPTATVSSDRALAHGLARLGLGVDILLHGVVRIPKVEVFATGLQEQFAKSPLPASWVHASGYGIAFGEAAVGVLLILGLFLRPTLVAGALLMIVLLFGTCLVENWNAAGTQLLYLAFYCGLLATAGCDGWSLDSFLRRRARAGVHKVG